MPREAVILPPVDCTCPQANHVHGTYTMYKKDGCRCQPCSDAMWRKNKQSVVRRQRGLCTKPVPATEVTTHVRHLKAAGLTLDMVATRAGVALNTVARIHEGRSVNVYATTAEKLLAVPAPVVPRFDKSRVDATGTRRRVHALIAIGHTLETISAHSGITPGALSQLASPRSTRNWVHTDTATGVRAAYDELWDQAPATATPAQQGATNAALNKAGRHGWLVPAAWDDDRIDDPTYQPNITALGGQRSAHDRLDELDHLLNAGVPAHEAAQRVGYSNPDNAYDSAKRIGRTTTLALLSPERNVA